MMTLMQSKREGLVTDKGFTGRCLVVKTGKYYGLTQKQVNEARKRFNDGEITFEEAMLWLSFKYSDTINCYIDTDRNRE